MRVGVTVGHAGETAREVAEFAAQAERSGLDVVGFSDSQSIFRETYSMMTAAALATERVTLAPTSSNVTTRHPVVSASAMATVDEISGGRAVLTVGTGASSTGNLGLPRATPRQLREGVQTFRAAFDQSLKIAAGEPVPKRVLLSWATRRVPVIVSCSTSGPLAMKVAAECADGALLQGDLSTGVLADRIERLRAIRRDSPVANELFSIWLYAPGFVDDDAARCRAAVGGVVSAVAASILDPDNPAHGVPHELRDPFRRFLDEHSFAAHADSSGTESMERLGVADYLFDRLALTGSAAEVSRRLTELGQLGVDTVVFTGSLPDKRGFIDRLGALRQTHPW